MNQIIFDYDSLTIYVIFPYEVIASYYILESELSKNIYKWLY